MLIHGMSRGIRGRCDFRISIRTLGTNSLSFKSKALGAVTYIPQAPGIYPFDPTVEDNQECRDY